MGIGRGRGGLSLQSQEVIQSTVSLPDAVMLENGFEVCEVCGFERREGLAEREQRSLW